MKLEEIAVKIRVAIARQSMCYEILGGLDLPADIKEQIQELAFKERSEAIKLRSKAKKLLE